MENAIIEGTINRHAVVEHGTVFFTRDGWTSEPYTDPTRGDAIEAFEASIVALDDYHHIYYEGTLVRGRNFGAITIEILAGS